MWQYLSLLCVLFLQSNENTTAYISSIHSIQIIYVSASDRSFYPKRLTVHSNSCFLEIKPKTFAPLTQCSTNWARGTQVWVSHILISLPLIPSVPCFFRMFISSTSLLCQFQCTITGFRSIGFVSGSGTEMWLLSATVCSYPFPHRLSAAASQGALSFVFL